ncbi:Uncharacterized protein CTYZ_00002632 [Cryptosporidium tyzzeri]|nr:Uncharacterized protein CTYZ_00002632 [Cryptosporidium tyzzeri]
MEYFDDDIISNMNRMEINKRPNIFDDLLGGDDETEKVNEEEDIFSVDEKRISNSDSLFINSYNKERNPFEDENREDEVIFGIERKREDEIGDKVDIMKSNQKRISNAFAMVGGIDFHEFNNNLNGNELNDDFGMDNKFESNEDIFSLSRSNRKTNNGEDERYGEEKKIGLVQGEKDILLQKEAYYREEKDPEQIIETKKNSISENLFGIHEEKQINKGNFNIENETPRKEELQFENPPFSNYENANPYIQNNKNLNELSCDKENELVPPGKSERKKSETNISDHNPLCESKEETNNNSLDKNNSETCVESNKIKVNNNLQSSFEDIDWNRVSKIIENFEKQTGNSGRNQMLFKSIIYKLANNNGNN